MLSESGVIVGALSHEENVYDGHSLPDILWHSEKLSGKKAKRALVDRGYRGEKEVLGVAITRPDDRLPSGSDYHRRQERKKRHRRSAIEPVGSVQEVSHIWFGLIVMARFSFGLREVVRARSPGENGYP